VPFLGLTVQPCREPCGSVTGFDFLTVEVIQIENKTPFLQCLNLCQSVVCSMFFTGLELTAKRNVLIQLKKHYYVLLQNKKNMLYRVAWFYAEPCRAQKHAQEDK